MPAPASARSFATQALLGLELLTLAVGVLQFAFAPATVERPMLAGAALVLLSVSILLVRMVPVLQRPTTRPHGIAIGATLVTVTLLAAATGAAHSALLTLYLVPLAALALVFGRWWQVTLLALVVAALGVLLGALTPGVEIASLEFAMPMLSRLLPGLAVALILGAMTEHLQGAAQRISDLAASDPLTGLLNLRAFEDVLQQEHRKAERFGRPYTLAMIDIDNLALVNETMGHDAGSQVIAAVAAAIARSIRTSDVAARVGGDDFVVLLTEADEAMGGVIAQRIRNNIYASTISVANRLIRANASVGIASFPRDHLYAKELMILADQRMQQDRELRVQSG